MNVFWAKSGTHSKRMIINIEIDLRVNINSLINSIPKHTTSYQLIKGISSYVGKWIGKGSEVIKRPLNSCKHSLCHTLLERGRCGEGGRGREK